MDVLNRLIKKYDLSPQDLHLKILERDCNDDDKENIFSILQTLKENNYYIKMVDFGASDSSLAMIANMPIDLIKLDRQFLNTKSSYKQKEVIHCIVQLSKALGLEIIVEGVETQEQADFLMTMGYQFAQGYHYYKPQPANSFLEIN